MQLHDYGAGSSPEAAVEVEMRSGRRGDSVRICRRCFPWGSDSHTAPWQHHAGVDGRRQPELAGRRLLGPWDRMRLEVSARLGMTMVNSVSCAGSFLGGVVSSLVALRSGIHCMVMLQPVSWSLSIFSTMCLTMYCPDDLRGSWQACIAAWLSVRINVLGFTLEKDLDGPVSG